MFELKSLSPAAIPAALAKAERYRLINEPEQSQSICEDILAADPANHDARVMLILALSDQFAHRHPLAAARALDLVAGLASDYERAYYTGLVAERRARALLDVPGPGARAAVEWLQDAMEAYERADGLKPAGNDEARLRWNSCARVLNSRPDLLQVEDAAAPVMNE
ncbi:MAG TPA: hypothetical protein VN700_13510 [Vicinamibacterales bacterium]|nr:hypothetical protein [Vicinamibacterales bacterium]